MTDPCNYVVPLALFSRGIIDQHAVQGGLRPVAPVVPDSILANAGHHKEARGDPFVDDASRRPLPGEEGRGGVSLLGFGTDCTVRSARLSSVKKRRPVPPSGGPASLVKIVTSISTLVPVLGITYRRHSVSPANASAGMNAKARAADRRCIRIHDLRVGLINLVDEGSFQSISLPFFCSITNGKRSDRLWVCSFPPRSPQHCFNGLNGDHSPLQRSRGFDVGNDPLLRGVASWPPRDSNQQVRI